ncbi:putative bifunctional diguanylate cyclase/phosphodiesterase [Pokkaliibacter sp. CJK22405]|uniref:putative bifunctional diguanylate cyclase/phosphodiesterase n=1 Tax=Pokkaliibacter sp. CJK22405 TaxID=3384615 RepID=UPI003984B877
MFNRSIKSGLMIRLGAASILFAVVMIVIQLYISTGRLANSQENLLEELLISSEKPLAEAIWSYDEVSTRKTLEGLMRLDQVAAVKVTLQNGEQYASFYKGEDLKTSALATLVLPERKIVHKSLVAPEYSGSFDGKPIGTLTIEGSNDYLFQQWTASSILLMSTLCGLILALFFVWAFVLNGFLSRPLKQLAEQLVRKRPDANGRLVLDIPKNHEADEIGTLVNAFNENSRELSEANQSVQRMATRDRLTNLPNRNLAMETLEQTVSTAAAEGSKLAVYFLDIDRFKNINDSEGHDLGDKVLIQLAERLTENFQKRGFFVSRLGGDEFMVINEIAETPEGMVSDANALLQLLRTSYSVEVKEGSELQKIHTSGTVGVVFYPDDGDSADILMRHGDLALLSAKNQGGDQIGFFTNEITQNIHDKLQLESQLAKAVAEGGFELYLQPKMSASSLQVESCEALLRWFRNDGTMVPPDVFIPVAESTRLIIGLGNWVVEEACRIIKTWMEQGTAIPVAINVSVIQLLEGGFSDFLIRTAEQYGVPARLLELELTESTLIDNFETVIEELTLLRDKGFRIALDDFGTGYSSLSNLNQLPIDVIKADKSFVRKLPEDGAITQLIGSIAEVLGVKLVAEGVETQEQISWLREHGFDVLQGFFFSQPVPVKRFETLFFQHNHETV